LKIGTLAAGTFNKALSKLFALMLKNPLGILVTALTVYVL